MKRLRLTRMCDPISDEIVHLQIMNLAYFQDHVPGFLKNVDEFEKRGVNNIVCVSVNDPFVMAAWGKTLDPSGRVSI